MRQITALLFTVESRGHSSIPSSCQKRLTPEAGHVNEGTSDVGSQTPPRVDEVRTDQVGLRRLIVRRLDLSNPCCLLVGGNTLPENPTHITLRGEGRRRRAFQTKTPTGSVASQLLQEIFTNIIIQALNLIIQLPVRSRFRKVLRIMPLTPNKAIKVHPLSKFI